MIASFKNKGRLGNFLFEAATSYAYSIKHGLDFTIPNPKQSNFWNPIYLNHLFKRTTPLPIITVQEQTHAYQDIPFHESWRGKMIMLDGYWQSYKYIDPYREEILNAFDIPWKMDKGLVSIHCRRTDFLKYGDKHVIQDFEYFKTCVEYFLEKGYTSFMCFSDDLEWIRKTLEPLRGLGATFQYSEGKDELTDLNLISCCEHNINSSSTFSWMGAWLNRNPDKIVLTPEKWFGPSEKLETKDIIPTSWVKVPV